MTIDYKKHAVDGLAWRIAIENCGVYPQAVHGNGGYEKRTEKMDGWNDCSSSITGDMLRIGEWINSIPAEQKDAITDLLLEDRIILMVREEAIYLAVNCNDLFFWACADMEEIQQSELSELIDCLSMSPANGGLLWCCRKRKMRPQWAYYKYFNEYEASLFDEAGPERDDPDGRKQVST